MRSISLFERTLETIYSSTTQPNLLLEDPNSLKIDGEDIMFFDEEDTVSFIGDIVSNNFIYSSGAEATHQEIIGDWVGMWYSGDGWVDKEGKGSDGGGETNPISTFPTPTTRAEKAFKDNIKNNRVDELYTDPEIILGRYFADPHLKILSVWNSHLEIKDPKAWKCLEKFVTTILRLDPNDLRYQTVDQNNDEFMSWGDLTGKGDKKFTKKSDEERKLMLQQHLNPEQGKKLRDGSAWEKVGKEKNWNKDPLYYNQNSRFSESVDTSLSTVKV